MQRHAADFGSDYKREDCIASVGGKHALFNAIQVLVDHGDEVILPVPYWVSFKDIVRYAGGEPVYIATDERHDFALTADMVERAITPRTKVIVLNSPSNPSGAVMKPEHMTAVLKLAHDRGIYVVSDECYVYLNFTGQLFSAGCVHEVKERLIIIGSLSKTYAMTGWRLGYALGPAPIISAMQKLQSQSTSNPTSIVQKAAVAALTGSQDCVQRDAGGLHLAARQGGRGPARDSRPHLRIAERRVLRLSQRQPLFRARRTELGVRCGAQAAARGARGGGSGRRLRHAGPRSDVVCGFAARTWSAAWSACASSSPACNGCMSELYPLLLIPIFDERPWGVRDLRPIYTRDREGADRRELAHLGRQPRRQWAAGGTHAG